MQPNYRRYFIELQSAHADVPRNREAAMRREQAAAFIESLHLWLGETALADKVAQLAITALGQVHITCEADLITQIHAREEDSIAIIRPAAAYLESMGRWER